MAIGKNIRTKIASIKNIQKITGAMELVAASKMRQAQLRRQTSRPYAEKIRAVIGHLAKGQPEYHHRYISTRSIKRVGMIVVTSDRGLCGSLNTNLLRKTAADLTEWQKKEIPADLCLIGRKAETYFRRFGSSILGQASHLGDKPDVTDLIGIVKIMLDNFSEGKCDAVYIAYNKFVNTVSQQPVIEQLLPLVPSASDRLNYYWDYIYEPDAKELLEILMTRYVESQVYQSVVENIASEQAARMVAMKNASDNAGELIDRLRLVYNKARQAAITQEIAEIVSGAAAV
jgi:F-type H+-transporting ATPase subunit gamma